MAITKLPDTPLVKLPDELQPPPSPSMAALPELQEPPHPAPVLAPQAPNLLQQEIASDNQRLKKVQWQQSHPWGTDPTYDASGAMTDPGNHPGKLGKIAHVFSQIGNIAGDVFAPGTMALIPGTQLNRQMQEGQLAHRLNAEQQEESLNEQMGAATKKTQEETQEMPGKTASEEALQGAQTFRAYHPLATSAFELWHQQNPTGTAQQYEEMLQKPLSAEQAQSMNSVWDKMAAKNGLPSGQFKAGMPAADANALSASLNNVIARGQGAQSITIKQEQLHEKVPMLAPDGKGGFTLQYIQPGQTVTPGSMTPTQQGSTSVATAATRTMAETAPKVIDLANRSEQLINQQINALGPMASRWSEFMAGKVGAPNPEFTKLRTNIGLLQTALMRMHVGARGGEQMMEHFRDLIDASKQDPVNLKAALGEIKAYADEVGRSGGGNAAHETNVANGGNAPNVGETKKFPNGKTGTWDGKGWVAQ